MSRWIVRDVVCPVCWQTVKTALDVEVHHDATGRLICPMSGHPHPQAQEKETA